MFYILWNHIGLAATSKVLRWSQPLPVARVLSPSAIRSLAPAPGLAPRHPEPQERVLQAAEALQALGEGISMPVGPRLERHQGLLLLHLVFNLLELLLPQHLLPPVHLLHLARGLAR